MTAPRTEKFVLVQEMGDLHDQLDAMIVQWDGFTDDEADTPAALKVAAEITRMSNEIDKAAIHGTFQRLPYLKWEAVKGEYPPEGDDAGGWDFAVSADFFTAAIRACWLEPEITDEEWDQIEARIGKGDRFRLGWDCVALNDSPLSIPKPQRPLPVTTLPVSGSRRRRASA